MSLSTKEKTAYGLGAVGKDMVYMLSASYILYYYQDLLGVDSVIMGAILMAARVFDAFNDPIMGTVVAKTKTKWGKFRPWLLIGTILNAIILFLMFSAPPTLDAKGMVVYAAVTYILWGVTYTMMDIPYWSMIPAFTHGGKEREGLSTLARSCAGVGSSIIVVITMMVVPVLGRLGHAEMVKEADEGIKVAQNQLEIFGFKYFAGIIAILFIVFLSITCITIKEKSTVDIEAPSIGQMFKALVTNDQAMTVVLSIVLINGSLYITSNLLIYFFKYDIAGANWNANYVLFNTVGGAVQILSMMILYPLVRQFISSVQTFFLSFGLAIGGYGVLLVMMCLGVRNVIVLLLPGILIFAAFGMLTVLTTVFLANTVDYGELKNGRRDESVIFSMQTFVVKLASGIATLIVGISLKWSHISNDTSDVATTAVNNDSAMILRLTMTVLPIIGMLIAVLVFSKKYILNDEKLGEINQELASRKANQE